MNRREFVIGAGAAAIASPALAQATRPGVSKTEILVGCTAPLSGPASAASIVAKAANGYFNYVNARGGVNGRRIKYLMLDDGYNPSKTVELARQLVEKEEVAATVCTIGTAPNSAIQKYMNTSRVPHLFVASGASKFGDHQNFPWTMGWQPTGVSAARAFMEHVLETKPGAKIAILYQNDDFGKDYVKGAHEALGDKAKTMIVAEASYEVSDPTIDSQIVTLKSSGADTLLNVTIPKFALQSLRKMSEIGWKPTQYITESSASVGQVMQPAGKEISTGIVTSAFFKDPTDERWQSGPEWDGYQDWMKRHFPEGDLRDTYPLYGYSIAQTFVQVLTQCGNDVSRANLMKQAGNLNLALPMLLPGIGVRTSGDDYFPVEQMQLLRFNGTNYERFGRIYGRA